jgi:hypothetical protein
MEAFLEEVVMMSMVKFKMKAVSMIVGLHDCDGDLMEACVGRDVYKPSL